MIPGTKRKKINARDFGSALAAGKQLRGEATSFIGGDAEVDEVGRLIVRAYNPGSALEPGDLVCLSRSVLHTQEQNPSEYQFRPVFEANSIGPTNSDFMYAICLEHVRVFRVGKFCLAGPCMAKVDTSEDGNFATIKYSTAGSSVTSPFLVACKNGNLRILDRPAGNSSAGTTVDCLVYMGPIGECLVLSPSLPAMTGTGPWTVTVSVCKVLQCNFTSAGNNSFTIADDGHANAYIPVFNTSKTAIASGRVIHAYQIGGIWMTNDRRVVVDVELVDGNLIVTYDDGVEVTIDLPSTGPA